MRMISIGSLLVLGWCAGCAAEVSTLYSQPTTTDPNGVGLCYYSSTVPRPSRNYKHADDFSSPTGGLVNKVRWWGISEARLYKNLQNVDQFTIEFYSSLADAGGPQIGQLLYSATFPIGVTNQTATGRLNKRNSAIEYRHEVDLPEAVSIEAGRTYFIAIAAHPVDVKRDAWGWQDGLLVNGYSQLFSYDSGTWSSFQDTDSAFELIGTVPSPGAGSGAILLLVATRRRRSV